MQDFGELVKFVEASAEEANVPVYGQLYNKIKDKAKQHSKLGHGQNAARSASFSTDVAASKKDTEVKKCFLCEEGHPLFKRKTFLSKNVENRLKIIRDKKLCFNCLSGKHLAARCKSTWACSVPGCGKKHSKLLHRFAGSGNSDSVAEAGRSNKVVDAEASALCGFIGAGNLRVALPVVPVKVRALGRCVKTCALLDAGSTNSFCSAALLEHLGVTGIRQSLSLTTLGIKDSIVQTENVSLHGHG